MEEKMKSEVVKKEVKNEVIDLDNYVPVVRPRAVLHGVELVTVSLGTQTVRNKLAYKSNNYYLWAKSMKASHPESFVWLQCRNGCVYRVRGRYFNYLRKTSTRAN